MKKGYLLIGGLWGLASSVLVLIITFLYSYFFWKSDPHSFLNISPTFGVILITSYPIQALFNFLLGEDNLVERYLLLPSVLLTFSLLGVLVGWIYGKVKNRKNTKYNG